MVVPLAIGALITAPTLNAAAATPPPSVDAPTVDVPDVHVPDVHVPNVHVPNVHVPNVHVPNVHVPNVHVPNVHVPNVHVPNVHVPNVHVPNVHVPNVHVPNVHVPNVHVPNVHVPNVHVPNVHVPNVHVPNVHVPNVHVTAFSHYGDLAFISEGTLWDLAGKSGKLTMVAPAGDEPSNPRFSPDGSWLSFTVSSGQVRVASADGSAPKAVSDGGGGGWLPDGELVAGNAAWQMAPTGKVTRAKILPDGLAAWSIDGTNYAYTSDTLAIPSSKSETGTDELQLSSSIGGPRKLWFESKVSFGKFSGAQGNFVDQVWVLAHGQGVLFTLDPDLSSSLAADGVVLYYLKAPGARPVHLGTMVGDAVATGPDGNFAFTSGPDRYAWLTKSVVTCAPGRSTCGPVPVRAGLLSVDPAWSNDGGSLAFVEAPSNTSGDFSQPVLEQWYGAHSLWVEGPGTHAASEVKGAEGASAPLWSASGTSLMYEADDALWLLPSPSSRPARVAGPLFQPGNWPDYYGQVDWSGQFAWDSQR